VEKILSSSDRQDPADVLMKAYFLSHIIKK
jgi:hypothetical protein